MGIPLLLAPPADRDLPHLPLRRLPAKGQITMAVTCKQFLQVDTHFYGRRTLPHLDEGCPGCEKGLARRYEAYVSGSVHGTKKHEIIALTARAAFQLLNTLPVNKNLRGRVVKVVRKGTRVNGCLEAEWLDGLIEEHRLPEEPDLYDHLLHIWGLDVSHIGQDHPGFAAAIKARMNDRDLPGQTLMFPDQAAG